MSAASPGRPPSPDGCRDDRFYLRRGKRILDLSLALPAVLLFSPVLAILACLVRVFLGRPVLFRQLRAGSHGRPFELIKFRTMSSERDSEGHLLPDMRRTPRFGRVLRSTSLDELPELWNVVRGDMSLVGPRPLLLDYLPLYTDRQRRRHEVPPGITGLTQVMGRNGLPWHQRFELDVQYADTVSLGQDVRILLRTVQAVVARRGVNQDAGTTSERFLGSTPPRPDGVGMGGGQT